MIRFCVFVGLIIFDHECVHQQARLTALFPVSAGREGEAREASEAKQIKPPKVLCRTTNGHAK